MNICPAEKHVHACFPGTSAVHAAKRTAAFLCKLMSMGALWGMALFVMPGCGVSVHDAVARGDINLVKTLLDKHPDWVNTKTNRGKTPLHYAVSYAQQPCMDLLLERGANINAQDATGMTPLHVAAMLGRAEQARRLLNHGALREGKDSFGDTPLHTAAVFGQGGMVQLLIEAGGDASMSNTRGKTPIDLAKDNRHPEVARLFESTAPGRIQ